MLQILIWSRFDGEHGSRRRQKDLSLLLSRFFGGKVYLFLSNAQLDNSSNSEAGGSRPGYISTRSTQRVSKPWNIITALKLASMYWVWWSEFVAASSCSHQLGRRLEAMIAAPVHYLRHWSSRDVGTNNLLSSG